MKKIIALVFALFFATAAVAESFVASEKITQQLAALPRLWLRAMRLRRLEFYMKI